MSGPHIARPVVSMSVFSTQRTQGVTEIRREKTSDSVAPCVLRTSVFKEGLRANRSVAHWIGAGTVATMHVGVLSSTRISRLKSLGTRRWECLRHG